MTEAPPRVRWNFEVDRELNKRLDDCIPFGYKAQLFRATVELIVSALEKHGLIILGAILSGEVELRVKQKDSNAAS